MLVMGSHGGDRMLEKFGPVIAQGEGVVKRLIRSKVNEQKAFTKDKRCGCTFFAQTRQFNIMGLNKIMQQLLNLPLESFDN
jgi:hypothetical protein